MIDFPICLSYSSPFSVSIWNHRAISQAGNGMANNKAALFEMNEIFSVCIVVCSLGKFFLSLLLLLLLLSEVECLRRGSLSLSLSLTDSLFIVARALHANERARIKWIIIDSHEMLYTIDYIMKKRLRYTQVCERSFHTARYRQRQR